MSATLDVSQHVTLSELSPLESDEISMTRLSASLVGKTQNGSSLTSTEVSACSTSVRRSPDLRAAGVAGAAHGVAGCDLFKYAGVKGCITAWAGVPVDIFVEPAK